jgi:CubicO group peptidase (beta-lactamase class C family)
MAAVVRPEGSCDPRFAPVRDAFVENFRARGELGAAVAVVVDGRPVVDLWAGWADDGRTRPWRRDTLVDVFSVGKAMAAIALLRLAERGRIALDARVARAWPEFAAAGKGDVTVRTILAHRAGLPGIRRTLPALAMYDWDVMTSALAAETPWWEPGSRHGYHVNTFGFLVGELVRRAGGEPFAAFFRREIAAPLGADFYFGIGPADDARIADFVFTDELRDPVSSGDPQGDVLHDVYANPPGISGLGTVNTRAWRAAVMPSTNGHATARAIARIYAALASPAGVDGIRLLAPDTLAEAIREASGGPDAILGRPTRFGLGVQLTQPERPLGAGARAFGHFGAGGALGFADPDAGVAFGYAMNRAGPRWQNPRIRALVDAVYTAL